MSKKLLFGIEAREKLLKGVRVVEQAVGSTLGPKSSNVAIDRPFGPPVVIHDGVSVSKEIDLPDEFENMGAQLVKESAQKTNDSAGDGTTTATILTEAIVSEALKNIAAGSNPMILRKGIEQAVSKVVDNLKKMAKPISTNDEIKQIATISAQDEEIGGLISGAIKKLGKGCIITVEESGGTALSIDYKEGMEFNRGYISHHFITNPETSEVELTDPFIIITDERLSNVQQFSAILAKIGPIMDDQKRNTLLIIAEDVTDEFLASMALNKIKGILKCVAVKAPEFGDNRKYILEDIATISGGNPIFKDAGGDVSNIEEGDLGQASRVVVTKDNTVIIGGKGIKSLIDTRVEQIKNQIESAESEFAKEKLQERLAKLTSGIAVINVGANSEMEMREKKERCIDAINATKSAIEEGIVPGGETALLRAAEKTLVVCPDDQGVGVAIVLRACKKPFERLMTNSGYNSGQMLERLEIHNEIDKCHGLPNAGVDVMDGLIKDMIEAGIIDPVKVTRCAIQNASSCAIMIMSTDTLICEEKEPKKEENGFN